MSSAALSLYSAAMWLVQPLLRRKLRRRGAQEAGYLEDVPARFGRYAPVADVVPDRPPAGQPERRAAPRPADAGGRFVWIHAVSLGETRAAGLLIAALRQREPRIRILLTHGTATGRAEGTRMLRAGDVQTWLPWDTPGAVSRFLKRYRPRIGALIETEVWPNLVAGCEHAGVPLVLVNARLSDHSLAKAERLSWLSRPAYGGLHAVYAQSQSDARRLRTLGAPVAGVYGNLKFDATLDPDQRAMRRQGEAWRGARTAPVIMLAVSREGEEAALIKALRANASVLALAQRPGAATRQADDASDFTVSELTAPPESEPLQWLVVPRHPQRFDEVQALFEQAGYSVSRRSRWAEGGSPEAADVWLGDTMGEMALYYGLADVALLGGSFAALGGQNLIEAALCGCPVVMGPSTFNFEEAAEQALAAGAAFRVDSMRRGVARARLIAFDRPRRAAASTAAEQFAEAHRGAAEKTAKALALAAREVVQRPQAKR
jgi:3-deoxy-D-manno-octulosonic-acid transferase